VLGLSFSDHDLIFALHLQFFFSLSAFRNRSCGDLNVLKEAFVVCAKWVFGGFGQGI
jgi:hypothetical protein